ncbi:MAG TPA: PAS domain S-box protein [Burkholderiales bacterium]|nr:PAS domain S-box protein [Burkholderiales bacterium]
MARARQKTQSPTSEAPGSGGEEQPFRRTFELAGAGLAHIGLDRRFLRVNRRLCEILGYSEKELVGRTGREISHPDDLDIINALRPRLYSGEEVSVRAEKRYLRKDGSVVWVATTMVVERDDAGEPQFEIAVFEDVTSRKDAEAALRESEERFRAVVNSLSEGILVYDQALNIVAGNFAAEQIIGLPIAQMLGKPGFTSLVPCVKEDGTPLPPSERPTQMSVRSGKPMRGYVVGIKRPDGSVTWLSTNTAFLRRPGEQKHYGVVSSIADITAQRAGEAALRESEERFRHTFELAASGIAHVDLDGRFLRVNRSLCEMFGYPESELIGRSVKDISHPDDRDVTDGQRERVRSGELESAHFEKRYLRGDGGVLWVDLAIALVRAPGGEPLYEIAIFDDITERKDAERALRKSEERFRSLTQISSDWYWEQDDKFRLTFMSGRMGERTGLDPSSYLGRQRWDTPALNLTEDDWRRHREQLVRHEPFHDFEMQRPNEGGGTRWVSLSGEPLFDEDGRFAGYRGVGKDITERKRAEEDLRRAHADLERKATELERSNSELEQFAYVASHDLQEPLRMVSSYTQLVLRRYGERLDGDAKEFMAYVVDGAARMKQLIEDLLAYSRVGTRGKEFKPVPVETAVRRAINNLRAALEETGASITYDAMPTVEADDVQLAQVFQNLMGNALKFRSASVPRIHVAVKEQADEWEFAVQDNGIGIEPQYFDRIFMVFQQLHTKGEFPGTGIGLAICKKVVERHGGRIWVSSKPGEGSTFHFTLPKKRETGHG